MAENALDPCKHTIRTLASILATKVIQPDANATDEVGYDPEFFVATRNNESLLQMIKRKARQARSISEFFEINKVTFTFEYPLISRLEAIGEMSPSVARFYASYILNSFLSWVGNWSKTGEVDGATIIWKALLFDKCPELSDLLNDAFLSMYHILIHNDPECAGMVNMCGLFFSREDCLPPLAYHYLVEHCERVLADCKIHTSDKDSMLALLRGLLATRGEQFSEETGVALKRVLEPLAERFNEIATCCYMSMASILPVDVATDMASYFPRMIFSFVIQEGRYFAIPDKCADVVMRLADDGVAPSGYNFVDDVLSGDLEFSNSPTPVGKILRVGVNARISASVIGTSGRNETTVQFLVSMLDFVEKNMDEDFVFDYWAVVIAYCAGNHRALEAFDVAKALAASQILDPKYNIYNSPDGFEMLGTARDYVLELAMGQNPSAVLQLFKEVSTYPELFAEMLERAAMRVGRLRTTVVMDKSVLRGLCSLMNAYNGRTSKACRIVRQASFKLINLLFTDDFIAQILFNEQIFTPFFVTSMFNVVERPALLVRMSSFMRACRMDVDERFIRTIETVVHEACETWPDPRGLAVFYDILDCLCDVFRVVPEISVRFWFVVPAYLEKASIIDHDYFQNIMRFATYLPDWYASRNMNSVVNTLLNDIGMSVDDALYEKLIALICGTEKTAQKSFVMDFLLKGFWDTKKNEIMDEMIGFSKRCSGNAVILHECELDMFLVAMMKQDPDISTSGLELLKHIASIISSPMVVHKFVSLLCPNEDGTVPHNHDLYVGFLNEVIMKNYKRPMYALESGTAFDVPPFAASNSEFGFSGWIFCESSDMFRLFSCDGLNASIVDGKVVFGDIEIKADVPVREWLLIGLIVSASSVTVFVNDREIGPVEYVWNQSGLFTVLGGEPNRGRLSNFGFFPQLSASRVRSLRELGPRSASTPSFPFHSYFTPQDISDLKMMKLKDPGTMTFVDVFLNVCEIELILPLFAQVELKSATGEECAKGISSVVSLLKSALLIGEEQEAHFVTINGFGVISHLLVSMSSHIISFELYLAFYDILREIADQNLIGQLMKEVLLNFDIWSKSGDFVKISEHWSKVLFEGFEFIIKGLLSGKRILNAMRIYLWYEKTDEFAKERNLNHDEIRIVRGNLNTIIAEHYASSFNQLEHMLMLGHAMTVQDERQVKDIMDLVGAVIDHMQVLMSYTEPYIAFSILVLSTNEDIVAMTLLLIAEISRLGFVVELNLTCADHIAILFHIMKYHSLSDKLVTKLTSMVAGCVPQLFECVSYMAVCRGEAVMMNFFDHLGPSSEFCTSDMWVIWSIYGIIRFNKPELFGFLVRCSNQVWVSMYCYIEHVCHILGVNARETERAFIHELTKAIHRGDVDMFPSYYNIVREYMFFAKRRTFEGRSDKPVQHLVGEWRDLIIDSIWFEGKPKSIGDDIEALVLDTSVADFAFSFGLDMDKNGKWVDEALALEAMALCESDINDKSAGLALRMAVFLLKWHDVSSVVNKIRAVKDLSIKYNDVLSFIEAKMKNASPSVVSFKAVDVMFSSMLNVVDAVTRELIGHCHARLSRLLECARKLYTLIPGHLLMNYGQGQAKETAVMIASENEMRSKEWRLMWSRMTTDHAPWNYRKYRHHYARDFHVTYAFCPLRMKVNKHFDPYTAASEMRESGEIIVQEEKSDVQLRPLDIVSGTASMLQKATPAAVDNRTVLIRSKCTIVTVKGPQETNFMLYKDSIEIGRRAYRLVEITQILWRRFHFRPTGLEFFFNNGKSVLLDFGSPMATAVAERIDLEGFAPNAVIQRVPAKDFITVLDVMSKWERREISNFEYLIQLNMIAGRTFRDPSQYPIFPWVVSDYDRETIDINDPAFFRDLSSPIGALGSERLTEICSRLDDLRQFGVPPFMYSSYCSSPISVFGYFIRMEPFTLEHIQIQGGRFDNAPRIFWSIPSCYKSVTSQMNDYRELTPEFFFQPEFLCNLENYDLGSIGGVDVGDVQLPKWASNAMEFVYFHRKALESKYVTGHLNNWIDLMFGVKQVGEEAVKARNWFKEEMYDNIWEKEPFANDLRRAEILTTIEQVGQLPPQLFTRPHPRCVIPDPVASGPDAVTTLRRVVNIRPSKYVFAVFVVPKLNVDGIRFHVISTPYAVDIASVLFTESVPVKWKEMGAVPSWPTGLTDFVSVSETKVVALSNNGFEAVLLDLSDGFSCTKITTRRQRITAISGSPRLLALSTDDARTHVYFIGEKWRRLFSIPTYRKCVTCTCVSHRFGIVVSGTGDRALVISLLKNGSTTHVVEMSSVPEKIIITPTWGFIVVSGCEYVSGKAHRSLSVYNVNGIHIRTVPFEAKICHWCAWANRSGFDFVAAVNERGCVYAFEAFFCNVDIAKPYYDCRVDVIGLNYSHVHSRVCVVTSLGHVHFVPLLPDQLEGMPS